MLKQDPDYNSEWMKQLILVEGIDIQILLNIFSEIFYERCRLKPRSSANIKMLSYQYRNSHYKDNMVPYNRNSYTCKDGLY